MVGCLLGQVLFGQLAYAQDIKVSGKHASYKLTLPENWTERNFSNGVQLTSSDNKASLAITVLAKEGIEVDAIQQMLPSKLGLTEVKKEALSDKSQASNKAHGKKTPKTAEKKKHFVVTGLLEGVPMRIELKEEKNSIIAIVSSGDDPLIQTCLSSLTLIAESSTPADSAGK